MLLAFLVMAIFAKGQVAVLPTVNDIASYSDTTTTILFIKDTIRGGQFLLYSGSDAADNGMIFTDALAQKWKRVTYDDKINVRWYGAHQDSAALVNDVAFKKASDYIFSHRKSFTTLKIPEGAGWYYKDSTMFYTKPLAIEGEGSTDALTSGTKISFPWNVQGIVFHSNGNVYKCSIKNLRVRNFWDGTLPRAGGDTSKALIETRAVPYPFENVWIDFATNIGFKFEGCIGGDSTSNPITGATDYGRVTECGVTFAVIGFYTNGCDANYMNFYGCEAGQNTRWGFYDNGFLGNNFYGAKTQANSNASITGTATTVTYGVNYYAATFLHDDGSGIGKRPDLQPTYWRVVGAQAATVWDTTKHYWSGGGRTSTHPSGTSQWYGPYDEGDQASPQYNTRTMQFGGVRGAGTPAGTIYRDQGTFSFNSPVVVNSHLGVRINDVANLIYPLMVENPDNGIIARFRGASTAAIITLESSGGSSSAYWWSQGGNAYFGVNGLQLQYNSTAIIDYVGDSVVNLGGLTNRWKNVYAGNYFGSGINLTLNTTATTDTNTYKPLVVDGSGNQRRSTYWYGGSGGSSSYIFSTGLTNTSGTITNNLSTGVSSAQNIYGTTTNLAEAVGLTINSTIASGAANKGKINIGTFAGFNEYQERFGVGTQSPQAPIHILGGSSSNNGLLIENTNSTTYARQDLKNDAGDLAQVLLAGSAYSNGITTPSSASFYNNGSGGINIIAGHSIGMIKFATQGNATGNENWRIAAGGNLSNTQADGTAYMHLKSGTATASTSPLKFTSGALNTIAEAGGFEYLTNTIYASPSAANRGAVATVHFTSNTSDFTASNTTNEQPIFAAANDRLTVIANTTYRFELFLWVTNGATTTTKGISFNGGTCTFTNIFYVGIGQNAVVNTTGTTQSSTAVNQAAVTTVLATGTTGWWIKCDGIMRIANGGTLLPQFKFSANPTGTVLIKAGSYMVLYPLGSNTNASIGNWN